MFIICVHAPMWFAIKSHSSCKDGARHFHQMVARLRYLSEELKKIIDPVSHRNSNFCSPGNYNFGNDNEKNRITIGDTAIDHILKN